MATYRFRKNGGQVLGASVTPDGFGTIAPEHDIVTDPLTPDGIDLAVPKFFDGVTTVRNATAPEIAAFSTHEASDENLIARSRAKDLVDVGVITRKQQRALIEVLLDEINTLRDLHALAPRTMSQAVSAIKSKIDAGTFD